ncbi:MAG: hypothetical protein H6673_11025 [Anaerolineales bacterium]|nr:hypothetical protein [Anaerolineales bacterium]
MYFKLFVQNLAETVTIQQLQETLSRAGNVMDVQRPFDEKVGKPALFAFVTVETEEEAETVIKRFNGAKLGGQKIKIQHFKPRPPKEDSEHAAADMISLKLGEVDRIPRAQVRRIVELCGEEFANQLLEDATKLHEEGRVMTQDGTRTRTLGGIFFRLARDRMEPEDREKTFPSWAEVKRRRKERKQQIREIQAQQQSQPEAATPAPSPAKPAQPKSHPSARDAGGTRSPQAKSGPRPSQNHEAARPTTRPPAKAKPTPSVVMPSTPAAPEISREGAAVELGQLRQQEAHINQLLVDVRAGKAQGSMMSILKEMAEIKAKINALIKQYPDLT